jgi:hypothetical protein
MRSIEDCKWKSILNDVIPDKAFKKPTKLLLKYRDGRILNYSQYLIDYSSNIVEKWRFKI